MLNDNELQISNKSYTNKDFASIYPELLELAKKLTNKWDPSTSNESDPGVVLLKLLAFIGDKTNYNIDKNILEAFLPSATQESSMRKLCEMNGYEMGYYNSATTPITFMYKGIMNNSTDSFVINLSAYDTVVTGTDGTVTYVLLDRVELKTRGESVTKSAIEGTLKYLRGTDGSYVQVANLDDNNRIYFPERFVAVNGIFIANVEELNNLWDKVDNLNTEVPGTKCFKFGFDSVKNLPYIEFPDDIASLIGSGLDIKYIITQGADGNVKAYMLNKLYNTTDITSLTTWTTEEGKVALPVSISDLVITNNSASVNGANPDTIDEAYNNFKKTVGTFSTLVTPRDYANFLYRLLDSYNNYEVSNVQVADRRTDINYGNNVVSFNELGQYVVSNEDKTAITPFELCVYPLNSINGNYDSASYYNSFKRKVVTPEYFNEILESVKTISHDMKTLDGSDVYTYKNYYKLNAKITTTKKVTNAEAQSVINNVKTALYTNFNAREVDYGYEIPFDSILNVIQNADARIKNVSLDEPELVTKVMLTDTVEDEVDYNEVIAGSSEHVKLLAKNIVAGRISLFDYYDDFTFEFFQSQHPTAGPVITTLDSMTTLVTIPIANVVAGYTLKKNEVIQLVGPNLATKITYPAFVNFWYQGGNVEAKTEYELKLGEILKINYTDTDDVEQNITYTAGTIIRTSFELIDTQTSGRTKITKSFNGTPLEMNQLTTKETIEIRDVVSTVFDSTWKCYWLLDEGKNPDNILFATGTNSIVLSEGESFLYTDDAMTELVILGSGTKLTLDSNATEDWILDRSKLISQEKINDQGLAAFSSIDWKQINFATNNLTIQEMVFYTFGEGTTVKISNGGTSLTALTNTHQSIPTTEMIEYKDVGSDTYTEVPQYDSSTLGWEVYSRLDINTSSTAPQEIDTNQAITLTYVTGWSDSQTPSSYASVTISKVTGETTLMSLNIPLQRSGGVDVDLRTKTFTEQKTVLEWNVSAYVYTQDIAPETLVKSDDYIIYDIKNYTKAFDLPLVKLENKNTLIMFYWNKPDGSLVTGVTLTATGGGAISKYNQSGSNGALVSGLNIIQLTGIITKITVTIAGTISTTTPDTLIIGAITPINDLNYDRFVFDAVNKATLTTALLAEISALATLDTKDIFYYTAPLDNSHLIEVEDLSSPLALFDHNNVANQFTLAEIDVDSTDTVIDVVRSSRI